MCTLPSLRKYQDWGLLVLRLVVGAVFLYHGTMKFGAWSEPAEGMTHVIRILSIVEPLGGLAIILGLCTQCVALVFVAIMVGAVWFKMQQDPTFGKWEFELLILASSLMLAFTGGGKMSADAAMKKGM